MQNADESAIIEKWKEAAANEPEYARRLDYGALAIQFADAVNRKDLWKNALREWSMIESSWLKEWEDLGRRKEAAEAVLEVLQEKFGTLPADLPNHLKSIEDLKLFTDWFDRPCAPSISKTNPQRSRAQAVIECRN